MRSEPQEDEFNGMVEERKTDLNMKSFEIDDSFDKQKKKNAGGGTKKTR